MRLALIGQRPIRRNVPVWLLILSLCWSGHKAVGQPTGSALQLDSVVVLDAFGQSKALLPGALRSLQARENYLTFRFRSVKALPVRYQLTGLDNDWRTGLSTDRIHYANLPGGTYAFRWQPLPGGSIASLPITIDAPFWQQGWFVPVLLIYLLGIAGIVLYLLMQYRFRQQLRDLQARDRIARDLHDDMGSYLSSISILSASARRQALRNPEKTQATLDTIGQTARQMLETMGDIVWSINPAHDAMSHSIDRMRDVGNALFASTATDFSLVVDNEVGTFPLATEARRDFFLIYKEALTNAARYAEATTVRVTLRREPTYLLLTVQDDGRGFDPANPLRQNPTGGNGLRNLQVRTQQLGGTLTISSKPGAGTTVGLQVPLP
ncbi:sensor histidine kinase [Fibrella sp. WM1]|uniref:sensor histidine kinase n=1 Tax=Fibrella musci TaxID=3242485 RepID=UPI0035230261